MNQNVQILITSNAERRIVFDHLRSGVVGIAYNFGRVGVSVFCMYVC